VIFDPLSHDKLKEIVKIQMKGVVARVANKGISLHASDAALDIILSESYDPVSIKASSIDHTKSLRLSLLGQVVSSLCACMLW
jgi:ATP-dependent Clp protease ATP-binding subunit ClpA